MEKNEVITLEDRGFIQVSGVEAKDFLQNIVTNNLERVTKESTIFSSILTPQGKYLFEFFVIKLGDNYLLESEKKSTNEIIKILNYYKLRSKVDFDTWDDLVSSTNHTLGFKKFSDYQLETNEDVSVSVGLSTDLTSFEVINDLIGYGDLNCDYDFDLVQENSLTLDYKIASDEIIFNSRVLTDYYESIGNRVLSIDDISPQFNSHPRATAFSVA